MEHGWATQNGPAGHMWPAGCRLNIAALTRLECTDTRFLVQHLVTCPPRHLCFLNLFSHHLPKQQCSPLDRLQQLSPGGHSYVHYDFQSECFRGYEAKQ
ncbi:hypothetical protein TNCV_4564601 [Trichonephila clavipes]|nr:hypothetical protein TNCV_4564601 [Trichonephila clavipes]